MTASHNAVQSLTGVSRLDSAAVAALLGAADASHLKAKATGGANGFKGFRYEHLFGAHRIARLARKYLEDGIDARVEWQSDSFVDDFVVRRDDQRSFKGYQAKNAQSVSWVAGNRTIEQDFLCQKSVCTAEGYSDVRLRLVCSSPRVASKLQAGVPASIQAFSKAIHFPYAAAHLMPVLKEHSWMSEDFAYLSKFEAPQTIQVSDVAGILMGAWSLLSPVAQVSDVLLQARTMSPTLVRAFQSDAEAVARLNPRLVALMGAWPGFSYRIVRGFLAWSAFGGSTYGVLSKDCFDPTFSAWQEHILALSPLSFDQVEGAFS